jgi:hypothetical protein
MQNPTWNVIRDTSIQPVINSVCLCRVATVIGEQQILCSKLV